jgi:hypothetical protein
MFVDYVQVVVMFVDCGEVVVMFADCVKVVVMFVDCRQAAAEPQPSRSQHTSYTRNYTK